MLLIALAICALLPSPVLFAQSSTPPLDNLVVNDITPWMNCGFFFCGVSLRDAKTNTTSTLSSTMSIVDDWSPVCGSLCQEQFAYIHAAPTTTPYPMLKPNIDSVQTNGVTFGLRVLSYPRDGSPTEGTIISMPGVFDMKTIGPRWAMHIYQQSPQNQGSGYDETPWEPYDYQQNQTIYEDVYYTFTQDGRVRIDKFTPYVAQGGSGYVWEESVNDSGWPATWQNGHQVFAPVNTLFWGDAGTSQGIDAFRELLVFKQSLTTDQLIAQENFYHPSNGTLATGMSPCNSGNWVNQNTTVLTPCGPVGQQQVIMSDPTNLPGYNLDNDISILGGAPPGPCTGVASNPPVCSVPTNPDLPTAVRTAQPGDQYNFPASSSATFTVNAGATTFSATQPNDSVATYVWEDGGGVPSEWLTSANGSSIGAALEFVPVANYAGVSPSATITVNAGTTFQTIDGFGGAMTDSAASLILSSSNRNTIMDTLFGTDASGGGFTIVRSPMGSSDMMADPNDLHTYEDTQDNFSVTAYPSDNRQIAALQQAKGLAGSNFKLLGTPWTAPGWMKYGGSLLPQGCGSQNNEFNTSFVQQYAQYFTSYVNAYTSLGLQPWAVSMQNEPENCQTSMPTTVFAANDEVALAQALKGKMPNGVKLLGWDHNWDNESFVNTLTSNNSVDMVGYHCYGGTNYASQTQAVPTYFTECSGFTTGNNNVAENLGWEVANNIMGPLRYGSKGSLYWSLAQDPNGNPHYGGAAACNTCRGMITVNSDGSFYPSQDYYFWAQFSKFVAPGAVRIDSNNAGNLSTIAFHKGSTNILVVLNSSSSHADGGSGDSGGGDLRGHIVQWDGDTNSQKTAWLVGSDGYRRWISDGSTFNCLKYDAGMQGPDLESSDILNGYVNMDNVWAVCGAITMGTNSELEVGTYLKSPGGARLTLTSNGLRTVDSVGVTRWAPGGSGNRFILQADQNLVLYSGTQQVWASNTAGSGAVWLSIRDDGTFALFNKQNQEVWGSHIDNPGWYDGHIVQWDGDTNAQKSSWLVGQDGNRRWIADLPTFQCLQGAGKGNSLNVSSDVLNLLPNLNNVWATCGGTQIGPNGALEVNAKLTAGSYNLILQSDGNLVLYNGAGAAVWASNTAGSGSVELRLQSDGNLVLYDAQGRPHWSTNSQGRSPGWFILNSSGTLSLYDGSGLLAWSNHD